MKKVVYLVKDDKKLNAKLLLLNLYNNNKGGIALTIRSRTSKS